MRLLRSFAVGIAASFASIIAIVAAIILWFIWETRNISKSPGGDIGIDLVTAFRNVPYHRLIVLACFIAGFVWQFRRKT